MTATWAAREGLVESFLGADAAAEDLALSVPATRKQDSKSGHDLGNWTCAKHMRLDCGWTFDLADRRFIQPKSPKPKTFCGRLNAILPGSRASRNSVIAASQRARAGSLRLRSQADSVGALAKMKSLPSS